MKKPAKKLISYRENHLQRLRYNITFMTIFYNVSEVVMASQSSEDRTQELSQESIVNAPESEYMNDAQLTFFRRLLVKLHDTTRDRIREAKERMSTPQELGDETDRASWEEQCAISLRIVDREQKLLPKIQQSLERIRHGTYGYCLESGDPIGIRRLLVRPTAEYCADIKVFKEMKEHIYRD